MKLLKGGLENVPGYSFSAVECGIRYRDRLDYSIIVADGLCHAAGLFTTNRIFAAPVRLCRERIGGRIKGILINATNANACTGDEGYRNAVTLTRDMAEKLETEPESILMASTGIIGRQLPIEKMMASHNKLAGGLSRKNGTMIPKAIMTTDTVPKSASASFKTRTREYVIAGTAKGSGMIAPDMATLLAFIITDAPVSPEDLYVIFRRAVSKTLNSITIDGDMSTNDTAIILSPVNLDIIEDAADLQKFEETLELVLGELAGMLVKDAEGATKFVRIHVKNAASDDDARRIARAVSESLLVKTAFFGNDPNWGRIAAAAGYSGADVSEDRLSIYYGDIPLLLKGTPAETDPGKLKSVLAGRELTVNIDVGKGESEAVMMTSDISVDYVKINSEYAT